MGHKEGEGREGTAFAEHVQSLALHKLGTCIQPSTQEGLVEEQEVQSHPQLHRMYSKLSGHNQPIQINM